MPSKTRPYKLVFDERAQNCIACVFSCGCKCSKYAHSYYKDITCVIKTESGDVMGKFDYAWRA